MGYPTEYKKRAVALSKNNTAKDTFVILAEEYPTLSPDGRTLTRWKKDPRYSKPDDQQIQQPNNELLTTRKEWLLREHFEQMANIASTILGGLSGIRNVDNIITDYSSINENTIRELRLDEDEYEFDRVLDKGIYQPLTMRHSEVITELHNNIEEAYDKYRDMDLFEHFITHLSAEHTALTELDILKLHKYATAYPLELINLLKWLVLKKVFKGVCPICSP